MSKPTNCVVCAADLSSRTFDFIVSDGTQRFLVCSDKCADKVPTALERESRSAPSLESILGLRPADAIDALLSELRG
jgi:hypothetical protein